MDDDPDGPCGIVCRISRDGQLGEEGLRIGDNNSVNLPQQVHKNFLKYCLGPCRQGGKSIISMVTGPHRRCPLPPHPNPPPRRGEGWVGVMRVDIFMQRLGYFRRFGFIMLPPPLNPGLHFLKIPPIPKFTDYRPLGFSLFRTYSTKKKLKHPDQILIVDVTLKKENDHRDFLLLQ
jgi:hypothetical protein